MRKGIIGKLVCVLSIVAITGLTFYGCGSRRVNPNYAAYTETIKAYAQREVKPLVDVKVGPDGKIVGFAMYPQPKMPNIQQARPHPGWALAGGALRMAGIFGSIWVAGHTLENIIDSVSQNTGTSISIGDNNSWNAGKDVNASFGGGVNVEGNTTSYSPFNDSSTSSECCTGTSTGTSTSITEAPLFE